MANQKPAAKRPATMRPLLSAELVEQVVKTAKDRREEAAGMDTAKLISIILRRYIEGEDCSPKKSAGTIHLGTKGTEAAKSKELKAKQRPSHGASVERAQVGLALSNLLLSKLKLRVQDDGMTMPSGQKKLGKLVKVGPRTAQRLIDDLIDRKLIILAQERWGTRGPRYKITEIGMKLATEAEA